MPELDLTEAVDAGAAGLLDHLFPSIWPGGAEGWRVTPPDVKHAMREKALSVLDPAAPLIEAQVREMVAREIGFERGDRVEATENPNEPYGRGILFGLALAARIARGGAR